MSGSKTYILLHLSQNDYAVQIVRGILCELSGGFTLGGALKFILTGSNAEAAIREIDSYRLAYNALHDKNNTFFQQLVDGVDAIETHLESDATYELLAMQNESIWEMASLLDDLKVDSINENDKVIVVSNTGDSPSLVLHPILKAKLKSANKEHTLVRHVCWCDYKTDKDRVGFIRTNYIDNGATILTGLGDSAYKEDITLLQTIDAILNPSDTGVVAGGKTDGMLYHPSDFGHESSVEPFYRMDLLGYFKDNVSGSSGNVEKWMTKMSADPRKLWIEGESFPLLKDSIEQFSAFVGSLKNFDIDRDERTINSFERNLLAGKVKLTGLTEAKKRELRIRSLLAAIADAPSRKWNGDGTIINKTSAYNFPQYYYTASDGEMPPSPTGLWELTSAAFLPGQYHSDTGSRIRTACLNLWEMFFEKDSKAIARDFIIREHDMDTLPDGCNKRFFSLTDTGRTIIEERFLFSINSKGGSLLGYTSPSTGFAVAKDSLPADALELGDRAPAFQEFLYNYIRCVGGFSKSFTDYVEWQIEGTKDVKKLAESRGHNIIAMYPQLRRHVGLVMEDKDMESDN